MPFNDELKFEEALVNLLCTNCGWEKTVLKYPTEEDLIKNWANILFNNNKGVDVLNGYPLTDGEMYQIMNQVNLLKSPLATNNFINGKSISIVRDNPDDKLHFGRSVSLKIYDRMEIAGGKSRYQIAEQPIFKTNNSVYPTRRGDIMLLINGMPVFHIELKKTGVPISQAEVQIEKYMRSGVFTGIFSLVQVFVAMNPEDAVYFANPGVNGKFNPNFYFHWEDFNNNIVTDWKDFSTRLLSIPMAHEMVGFYTIPDDSDGILKVMRSYQFYAASSIFSKVAKTNWTRSTQHGGYIWHTTGSGKTMTSFKAAQLVSNARIADKVVFLIDRVELGDQSLINYRNFADPSESVQATEDTNVLVSKLTSDLPSDTLIVTSIQKMSRIRDDATIRTADIEKIKSKKLVFLFDECHRNQEGEMHQNIKKTFPGAIYFGFTGTPDHEKTADIFGDELHRYTIVHGIRDKNVLGFDPYKICTYDDNQLREEVGLEKTHCTSISEAMADEEKKNIFLYYMNKGAQKCSMVDIEKEIPKSQYMRIEHQEAVVDDILDKWIIRSVNSKFHAIFATSSIPEAIKYYNVFKDKIAEKHMNLKVTAVFDPSDNNGATSIAKIDGITDILTDYAKMYGNKYEIGTYSYFKKDVCSRLAHKNAYISASDEDILNIIIVVDQLLTGFDSKWINTLYLDKVLSGKNLIQAISRTNRLFGPDKPHGTIVWYRYPHTMEKLLEEAVESYSGNTPLGIFVDKLEKNLERMNDIFKDIESLFQSAGIINFEKVDQDEAWRRKYCKLIVELNKTYESAKIQGFDWNVKHNQFLHDDGSINIIDMEFDEKTYFILIQRYKELFSRSTGGTNTDTPYMIDSHITEIQTSAIDDNYMNSKFILYVKNLNIGDKDAKEKALVDLHNSFSALSEYEQKLARIILNDIETGNLAVDNNKTFRDYLTEYECNIYSDRIHKLAMSFGLDEKQLRDLMNLHVTEATINEFGRFDDLIDSMDINKAKDFFEKRLNKSMTRREASTLADIEIRKFILEGGFEI